MVYSIHFYMYQHQFLELGLGGYKYTLEGERVCQKNNFSKFVNVPVLNFLMEMHQEKRKHGRRKISNNYLYQLSAVDQALGWVFKYLISF